MSLIGINAILSCAAPKSAGKTNILAGSSLGNLLPDFVTISGGGKFQTP